MKSKFPLTRSRKTSETWRLAVLGAMQWWSLAKSVQGLGDARAAFGDPRVRAETRALLSELADASRRAREIGVTKAFDDKLIARRLSRAARHASEALDGARGRRRRRSASRRAFAATIVVGLAVGSAYAAWKLRPENGSPS